MKLNTLFAPVVALSLLACQPETNTQQIQAASETTNNTSPALPEMESSLKTADIRQDKIGKDFTITRHDNKPFTLSQYKGRFVMLTFGFSNCPSICPTELYTYSEAIKQLDPEIAKKLDVVFISVDPERDTPEIIGRFVHQFHPDFIGATDTTEKHELLENIKKDWHVIAYKSEVKSDKIYNMDHTAGSYIIDPQGETAYFIPFGISTTQLVEDLKEILS
ncbi:MAG: SCO family protein [Neisseriaceae bacterium]|nr:SCO family protein [Neisseriaceae bacterium]